MSRIGRLPVTVPAGVQVKIENTEVCVKGPKGELSYKFSPLMKVDLENGQVVVQRSSDEASIKALHGTTRALINNMVTGVSTGFSRSLVIEGVGYRAEMDGAKLVLYVGYSHPVVVEPPDGIKFDADTKAKTITISGFDKELVGQTAANVREIRPPEPYKGKGLRYSNEFVRRKPGKAGKGAKE